tara:strand:- start:15005 stop:15775 length:771 start_codon:yes stop_codon:yes gene_type:complete
MADVKSNSEVKPQCFLALHGFLSTSRVWKPLKERLDDNVHWYTPDLIQSRFLVGQDPGLSHVVKELKSECVKLAKDYSITAMGYSMGGRILAHLVVDSPDLFDRVFFLSADPFSVDENLRSARLEWQKSWIKKFNTMAWNELIEEWNSQSVFEGSKSQDSWADEENLDRRLLAESFEKWSRLNQILEISSFKHLDSSRIHWCYGELDSKYRELHKKWKEQGLTGEFISFPGCGHRFPFDNVEALVERLGFPKRWAK